MTVIAPPPHTGLCSTCVHARRIESARGSIFVLCELSFSDPGFPRYPRLPVVECAGYATSNTDS
jgi:hypothetical protein